MSSWTNFNPLSWAGCFVRNRYDISQITAEKLVKKLPRDLEKEVHDLVALNLLRNERSTKILTGIISYSEVSLFFSVTIFLYYTDLRSDNHSWLAFIKNILIIVAGWLAIKIFGNYGQWSGKLLGRTTYYIFLIGSFINILVGIALGFFLAISSFNSILHLFIIVFIAGLVVIEALAFSKRIEAEK